MAYKLIFRFDRNRYTGLPSPNERKQQIFNDLMKKTNDLRIDCARYYKPSRDSLKVLFPSEKELNKALKKTNSFNAAGFEPRLTMPLKAARTVYCHGFDPALLLAYTEQEIKENLIQAEWEVNKVYIMNSKKSLKIEMYNTKEARKFIESNTTSIGGIQLTKENKEQEIDPTVAQCWDCGILNPTHTSRNCPGPRRCLKCLQHDHQFHSCQLPKDFSIMTPEQKKQRYCIPCNLRGDHTSLDHRYCPEKRKIIQERVKAAREHREAAESENERDTKLIKKTLELANTEAWPSLQQNLVQQQKTSSIILLALLDENTNKGSFQKNLDKGLKENGLPTIKYTPAPGTASLVASLFTGTSNDNLSTRNIPQNTSHNVPQNTSHTTTHIIKQKTLQSTPQNKSTFKQNKPNPQAKIDGGLFNIIQRKDSVKPREPSAAGTSYNYTPTTTANMVALSPIETEPSLLRNPSETPPSEVSFPHHYYYRSANSIIYSSSEESRSSHASPTKDHQITRPKSFTSNNTIGETVTKSQDDNDKLLKIIATAKKTNVPPELLLSERTSKLTSERKEALLEHLECLLIIDQKF